MSKYRIVQEDQNGSYRVMHRHWWSPLWRMAYYDMYKVNCQRAVENHKRYGVFAHSVEDV